MLTANDFIKRKREQNKKRQKSPTPANVLHSIVLSGAKSSDWAPCTRRCCLTVCLLFWKAFEIDVMNKFLAHDMTTVALSPAFKHQHIYPYPTVYTRTIPTTLCSFSLFVVYHSCVHAAFNTVSVCGAQLKVIFGVFGRKRCRASWFCRIGICNELDEKNYLFSVRNRKIFRWRGGENAY